MLFPAADRQSCRALFQGAQLPFIDASSFAENKNDAVPGEYLLAVPEGLVIAAQIFHAFAYAVHWQDLEAGKQADDEFALEDIAAGERPDRPLEQRVKDYGVEEGIGMIAGQEKWPLFFQECRLIDDHLPAEDEHGDAHDYLENGIKQELFFGEYNQSPPQRLTGTVRPLQNISNHLINGEKFLKKEHHVPMLFRLFSRIFAPPI
jgi:hypothetical protein